MIKKHIAQLMDKEMDRKSFLMHVAAGAVAVFGASAALKMLSGDGQPQKISGTAHSAQQYGYGHAPYGY